jgi:hypothetical protein
MCRRKPRLLPRKVSGSGEDVSWGDLRARPIARGVPTPRWAVSVRGGWRSVGHGPVSTTAILGNSVNE